jgi:hypothetical protein
MKIFRQFVGWVARSKTQQKHTDILEMLGFILQPNLPHTIILS